MAVSQYVLITAFFIVGLLAGLALIPGVAFGLGKSLALNGLGRVLFTVCQLASGGLALVQRDRAPRYQLRVLASLDEETDRPDHVYLGRDERPRPEPMLPWVKETTPALGDSDVIPELRIEGVISRWKARVRDFWVRHRRTRWDLDLRELDVEDGQYYRLGKRPFVLLTDSSVIEAHRVQRQQPATDGGVVALDEERGGRQTWTPFTDTRDTVALPVRPLEDLNAETDYEGVRDVVRRTLPEHGDQTGIGDKWLVIASVSMFVVMFAVTLLLF